MATKTRKPRTRKAILDNITPSDLGMALHTALRKACDSKATSAAWNLIEILNEPWSIYLDLLLKELKEAKRPSLSDLREFTLDLWHPFGEIDQIVRDDRGSAARKDRRLITALGCVFEMFDDVDWHGYGSYLDEYGIRLGKVKRLDLKEAALRLNTILRDQRKEETLVSVGVGEVAKIEGIFVHVTDKNQRYVDILKNRGFMGYQVKIEKTGKFRPCV